MPERAPVVDSTTQLSREILRAGNLCVRIVAEGSCATHALPASGEVVVGRGQAAAIRIADATISRRHAILHVGPQLFIEDLGSVNGTRIGGRRIAPGQRVPLAVNEPAELGSALILVQPWPADARRPPAIAVTENRMSHLQKLVDRVAASSISVLLLGETGVGKNVMAQTIHARSPRADGPLVPINCPALPAALMESELFGHERGAFTGATSAKRGLIESANGGTVVLDEVADLALPLQAKLLRVLEERELVRVGAVSPRPIDVRFIAATNRDLDAEVQRGTFRQDLFFRLNGVSLYIPPLRERTGEIEPLAKQLIGDACRADGRAQAPKLTPEALAWLLHHRWPGNIRELRNVINRAILLCAGDWIAVEHVSPNGGMPDSGSHAHGTEDRERILAVLAGCGGNQSEAARRLGISRNTLLARLDRYGVPRPRKGHRPPDSADRC